MAAMDAPGPSSPSPSQQLHEKRLLFASWSLDDDSQTALNNSGSIPAGQNMAELSPMEKKHRRRSKAFARAARAAQAAHATHAAHATQKEAKAIEENEAGQRPKAVESTTNSRDGAAELIDLTEPQSPPRPPLRPHPPRRSVSTVLESETTSAPAKASLRRTNSTPLPATSILRGKKRAGDAMNCQATKAKNTAPEKRRDAAPPLVPERQGIFAGLAFYYLPDVALGARRVRIAKARQHGAQWVRQLREATHVVVDKHLAWSEVAAVVRNEGGDETRPILVNETYPLDCIGFRCLLNPAQQRYRIRGWTDRDAATAAVESSGPCAKETKRLADSSTDQFTIKPDRRQLARLGSLAPASEHLVWSRRTEDGPALG
ncbi:hypothetical protein SEPCBS119000_001063 [Sporothrix epigloea]|uniref:BRCT domain-containing protein n=1 Tax=Sporothrix epigloea TaxID=1892477 RepID=A0ABP0D9P6_9PEZI